MTFSELKDQVLAANQRIATAGLAKLTWGNVSGFDQAKEPTDFSIAQVLTEFVPLSKLMAEQISGLRTWAKGRAKQATTQSSFRGTRKIAV